MPTYGKLDSFDESEDWTQYVERMEHYFNANEIDEEDQKRDIFLSRQTIAYTSRTLTSAEKNYSGLEKESLAIIFGIKKFHQYLYGHPVTIITDHKPLIGLFRDDKPIPTKAASRIQRWALTLAAYQYTPVYKEGSLNGNADGLSRLPLKTNIEKTPTPGETILLMEHVATTPVDAKQIQKWTRKDTILSMVLRYI
ncbi:unnamed protein product [Mytilus edulis]|uniref:Reverse transcriptase RNase H-like domain-containing protein n=1 Tax=Mytilus edulis TaxID=6550 RepID=A0A8S3U2E5_MYTED|nr:unnamed protein product [Mytilus edulis]